MDVPSVNLGKILGLYVNVPVWARVETFVADHE
jgi:hypothetical protein